jgi:small-conductance mechanosensitive channel
MAHRAESRRAYRFHRAVGLGTAGGFQMCRGTRSRFDLGAGDTVIRFLERIYKAVILLFAGVLVVTEMGYNVNSLIAGLGLGGLTFALADPALTGQVLGILCMMPFLYQYDFHIFPDFESESYYIRGSYDVKGRIQLIFLLVTAIRLLADKEIRSFLKKLLDHRE